MPSAEQYALAKAAAAALGTTPYKARVAAAMARGAASRAVAEGHAKRAAVQAARVAAGLGGPRRKYKDLNVGGKNVGKQTATSSGQKLRDELKAAKNAGQKVKVRVLVQLPNGKYRDRILDGRADQGPLIADGAEARRTGGRGSLEPSSSIGIVGDVQVTRFYAGSFGGDGMDPGELLDFLDGYDDWLDAIADLADADYIEGAR